MTAFVPLITAHRGGQVVDGVPAVYHDECTVSGRAVRDLAYRELAGELGPEALTFDELLDVAAGRVGLHLDLKETGYEAQIVHAALDRCPVDKLSLIHISEPTRLGMISYAVYCLK